MRLVKAFLEQFIVLTELCLKSTVPHPSRIDLINPSSFTYNKAANKRIIPAPISLILLTRLTPTLQYLIKEVI